MKIRKTKSLIPPGSEDPVSEDFVRVLDEVGFVADQRQLINGRSFVPSPAKKGGAGWKFFPILSA